MTVSNRQKVRPAGSTAAQIGQKNAQYRPCDEYQRSFHKQRQAWLGSPGAPQREFVKNRLKREKHKKEKRKKEQLKREKRKKEQLKKEKLKKIKNQASPPRRAF